MKNRYENIFWGILLNLAAGLNWRSSRLGGTIHSAILDAGLCRAALVFLFATLLAGVRFWGLAIPGAFSRRWLASLAGHISPIPWRCRSQDRFFGPLSRSW